MKSKSKPRGMGQPFKKSVLCKAKRIAGEYRIVLETNKDLGFIGRSVELPMVFADGKTPDKCYEATKEALSVAIAVIIECDRRPPQPASTGRRTEQVTVGLTAEDKFLLANAATNLGFKNVSDFIRSTALNRVSSSPTLSLGIATVRTAKGWLTAARRKARSE